MYACNIYYRRGQLGQEILRTDERPTLVEALSGIKVCKQAQRFTSCKVSAKNKSLKMCNL